MKKARSAATQNKLIYFGSFGVVGNLNAFDAFHWESKDLSIEPQLELQCTDDIFRLAET